MSSVMGVELGPEAARAVVIGRWRAAPRQTVEAEWDPSRPEELVSLLRARLGPASRIALSVGLGFLHLKQVKLPPLPLADRRRILALESDRFFPVQSEPLAISLVGGGSFAFAVDAAMLERWVLAFEAWAPVESVEPAPLSLARGLGGRVEGTFAMSAGPGERGLVELHRGQVHLARRLPPGAEAPEASAPPSRGGVPAEFLPALGSARGIDGALDDMLLPERLRLRLRRRRHRRLATAAAACVVSLGVAIAAVDQARERALQRVRAELAVVAPKARRAGELQARLAALDRESVAIGEAAHTPAGVLQVLAALSRRLPEGATILSARAAGSEWEIAGRAADAAAIVPLLERDELLENVRFLSASSRFREDDRTYETFSIAFRAREGS